MTGLGGAVDTYLSLEARRLSIAKLAEAKAIMDAHGLFDGLLTTNPLAGWRKIFGASFGT